MMSTSRHSPVEKAAESSARVAHELANLLDGSMRNVAMVRSLLNDQPEGQDPAEADSNLLARLQTAEQGMKQMALLLKTWLKESHEASRPQEGASKTLGDVVFQARALHAPAAADLGIQIDLHISSEASHLPGGRLFSVITNALRNSIEAIATSARFDGTPGQIEIRALVQGGQLRLIIADNGPGLARELFDAAGNFRFNTTTKPDGHGVGLALCRDIAASLGGTLQITNRDEGGTQVTLTCAALENKKTEKQESMK